MDAAIRLGLVAYGVVHLLVAFLAVQLALGHSSGKASSQGAMHELATKPFGVVLIWAVAVGMLLLVVWRLLEAAVGHHEEEGPKRWRLRAGSLGKAVVYGAVGTSALKVATGAGSSSNGRTTTARLMDLPAGPWIVGLMGALIIGYGANQARRGLTEKFAENLSAEGRSGDAGATYLVLGKAGYLAKGLSVAVVGTLFGYAAVTHEPRKSGGLDEALRTVLAQPFGPYLLGAIAAGIACYGLFCFARARHLST